MKTYEYTDDSWWDSVCDCQPPQLMPCYNLLNSEHLCYTYSCHNEDDCYRQALEIEGIIDPENDDLDDVDFEQLCNKHGINVVIHFDEDIEGEVSKDVL